MSPLNYTLLSDGASDRILIPLLNWLLQVHAVPVFTAQWADLGRLMRPPHELPERVQRAVELYPCDLLFVHRDAEHAPRATRVAEIQAALLPHPPAVCVVPVRMQEAWFLFDEDALREAAGRPTSTDALNLPALNQAEASPNPKRVLHSALVQASGFHGRRRRQFPVRERVHRLAELIRDFSPLRVLAAFQALEAELTLTLEQHHWNA